MLAEDLDGDGDQDILAGGYGSNISWYENTDGLASFGPVQFFPATAAGDSSVFAADLDGDGDPDALRTSDCNNKLEWFENTDGLGTFGSEQPLVSSAPAARTAPGVDLDGDGDPDVLVASLSDNKIAWYENADGLGTFGTQKVVTTVAFGIESVVAGDLDGDGDPDLVSGYLNEAAWYENTDGLGTFGPPVVLPVAATRVIEVATADLDGDGDQDVLAMCASPNKLVWLENTDGLGSFGPEQAIVASAPSSGSVFAVDMDDDGDQDVLVAISTAGVVAWYENTDGLASFGPAQVITTSTPGVTSIYGADMDADGDVDVLATWYPSLEGRLAWFENVDGPGTTWTQRSIADSFFSFPRSPVATDLDGDGDLDVLSTQATNDIVLWNENTDGLGTFGPDQIITTQADSAWWVGTADLDGDADQDVLVAASGSGQVLWYENVCSAGQPSLEVVRLGTPPNPAALGAGVTSGPVVGKTWDPVIDHTTFLPSALTDVVGVTLAPTNVLVPPFGTLLCDVFSFPPYQFTSAPGVPFAIPIPNDCDLVGVSLSSQGLSVDGGGAILLTNALDITIGSF